jgi:hypothetical protein
MTPSPLPSTSFSRSRIMPFPKVSSTWRMSKQCTGASLHIRSLKVARFFNGSIFCPKMAVNVNNGCSRKTHCFSQLSHFKYPMLSLGFGHQLLCLGVVEHHLQLILGDLAITVPWEWFLF